MGAMEVRLEAEENLLRRVLSTEEGRFLVHRVVAQAGTYGASFSERDATTNYREGRRSIGIELRELVLHIEPEYLELMEREARHRAAYYAARGSSEDD